MQPIAPLLLQVGMLNNVIELWRYPSAQACHDARQAARKVRRPADPRGEQGCWCQRVLPAPPLLPAPQEGCLPVHPACPGSFQQHPMGPACKWLCSASGFNCMLCALRPRALRR